MENINKIKYNKYKEQVAKIARKYQVENNPEKDSLFDEIIDVLNNFKDNLKASSENPRFYQYKPFGKYSLDQFVNEKNFLNIPSKFDDMYDTRPVVDYCVEKGYKKYNASISACIYSQYIGSDDNNGWDKIILDSQKCADKFLKIACFCTSYKNIPLWYYYAKQNTGVCFEYTLKDILNSLGDTDFFVPVIYTDNYLEYNPFTFSDHTNDFNTKGTIITNSLVKDKDWSFENEWRIIRLVTNNQEKGANEFIEIPITSITLGKNMKEEKKKEVIEKRVRSKIKVYSIKQTIGGLEREEEKKLDYSAIEESFKKKGKKIPLGKSEQIGLTNKERREINPCGTFCGKCKHYGVICDGCRNRKGIPLWHYLHDKGETCGHYQCCRNNRKHDCSKCSQLPCEKFFEYPDINMSDDFEQWWKLRMHNLNKLRSKKTINIENEFKKNSNKFIGQNHKGENCL